MLNIAICDDDSMITKQISRLVGKYLTDCKVSCYHSGEEFISSDKDHDIILLDIRMDGLDGIQAARKLRERGSKAVIIFISGIKEYVFNAFDVSAFNYLLKPIDEDRFRDVLERAVRSISENGNYIFIKTRDKNITVNSCDILYFENEVRKIAVHTRNEVIVFYGVMSKIEKQLGKEFFRCHRGYLVNLAHIAEYDTANIYLVNGDKIYLSRDKYGDFVTSYMRFLRNRGAFHV